MNWQNKLCNIQWLFVGIAPLLLISCHTVHPNRPTSMQQIQSELNKTIKQDKVYAKKSSYNAPTNVNTALMPSLSDYINPPKQAETKFDVSANKIPAREFFMGLIAGTKYNMVINPNVTGTISLDLKNVSLAQTMEAVKDIYGYEYRKTSYGYEVMAPGLETKIFHVSYLDVQRTGKSFIQLTTGEVTNVGTITAGGTNNSSVTGPSPTNASTTTDGTISSIETKSEMKFWKDFEKALTNMVGTENGRSVTVSPLSGIVSVKAYPSELRQVNHFINSLQSSLNRQVILEAKILEVQLNDEYKAGIDWAVLSNPSLINPSTLLPYSNGGIGQGGTKTFDGTDLTEMDGGIFAIRINGNFKLLVNLLQTQGNVQVLSSPHISTVNNQKAVIKVGQDEFFVTNVSTSNTIVGTNTIPSQDVSLTPFFSGITLDVTPEINSDDSVILHIHPSISKVKQQTKIIGLGTSSAGTANNLTLPLAFSTIRESDNIVRAKNGQVVVIGGLMENIMAETVAGTPWLSQIPFIGAAFRRTEQEAKKTELVILLRPIIATNQNMINQMEDSRKTFQILKRPFHQGSLNKEFGNEAERSNNE